MTESDIAISVEGLSKSYRIRQRQRQGLQETLLGQFLAWASQPLRRLPLRSSPERSADPTVHWALQDLSFEIPRGAAVGIIGHNGAGKSTLLKILARVTQPTSGQARIHGRMASLLEVGTGFHPDLSGRDNVMLNGSVLGMRRQDIAAKFDAVVDFSGVEHYIDTPIKYYSSGMKVRLAFAVAAHLDPDILVVDEVLAVGDAAFQKECLERIEEVGSEGRTVIFVSHQLTTVARLCSHGIVLDHGRKIFEGRALEAIRYYNENLGFAGAMREWGDDPNAPGDDVARLSAVRLLQQDGVLEGAVRIDQSIRVQLDYRLDKAGARLTPSIHIFDSSGTWVFTAIDLEERWHNRPRPAGDYLSTVEIPGDLLNEGTYSISVALATLEPLEQHCFVHECAGFTVYDPMTGQSARGQYRGEFRGLVRLILEWRTVKK